MRRTRLLIDQRWVPFTDTLGTALDKVESARPPRAQRDLVALRWSLSFVGVPAQRCAPDVRAGRARGDRSRVRW